MTRRNEAWKSLRFVTDIRMSGEIKMKEQLEALKAALQADMAALQSKVDLVDQCEAELDQLVAANDAAVAQAKADGIEAGKAMIQVSDPSNPANIYTQEQMNAAVNAGQDQVKGQLQPQIDQLNQSVAALQSQVDQAKADAAAAQQAQADAEAKVAADDAKIAQAVKDLA